MYRYENTCIAGINNAEEFQAWLKNGKPKTGYVFIRKIDGFNMGHYINLGKDYSLVLHNLTNKPRMDSIDYYDEIKEETESVE